MGIRISKELLKGLLTTLIEDPTLSRRLCYQHRQRTMCHALISPLEQLNLKGGKNEKLKITCSTLMEHKSGTYPIGIQALGTHSLHNQNNTCKAFIRTKYDH